MGYTINYSELDLTDAEKDERAIADMKEYLGEKRWELLHGLLVSEVNEGKVSIGDVILSLSLVGVQGFPVHAFLRTYCTEAYNKNQSKPDAPENS